MLMHKRNFHQIQHHIKILSSFNLVHTQYILFDAVEFQQRHRENLFVLGDAYLTPLSQRVQYLFVQHTEKYNA